MFQTWGDPSEARRQALLDLGIWLALILSVFAVYAQVADFDFTNYDDPAYVSENVHVQAGVTPGSIQWAFTAVVLGNWAPVTLVSHMLDCQLFGIRSGMHHLVNVLFHMLATVLLFALLRRATGARAATQPGRPLKTMVYPTGLATGARWPSAFAACVFALHPLHVGSVAWIAERKDVLSAFFWFLALYAYVRYSERPSLGRYLGVVAPFCLGLMSKPMLVTFPFTLLLFDGWPLRRAQWPRTLWEKLPLFALSAGASVVTYWVQRSAGAVQPIPLASRTENALISYVTYIWQMFWPTRLAVFYPYAQSIAAWQAAAAFAIILGVSALAIFAWRTRPYLGMGWFWYLGTLVPVIGLVQAGSQSHADRYTYIPMVGLSVMLAWGATDVVNQWAGKWPRIKPAIAAAAAVTCVVWMALAWKEASHWRNSETLFQHAIDATDGNWLAQGSLGEYLMNLPGRRQDAVDHLEASLRIQPDYADANNNLGLCLVDAGLCGAAIPHFEAALRAKPGSAQALNNLGLCQLNAEHYEAALPYFAAAARAKPDSALVQYNLGLTLSKIPGHDREALVHYQAALRLKPDYAEAHYAIGVLLASMGRTEEAISQLEAGQRIHFEPGIAKIVDGLRAGQRR